MLERNELLRRRDRELPYQYMYKSSKDVVTKHTAVEVSD